MARILTTDEYRKELAQNGEAVTTKLLQGDKEQNRVAKSPELMMVGDKPVQNAIRSIKYQERRYRNTSDEYRVWANIEMAMNRLKESVAKNTATLPTDFSTLLDYVRIDLSRRFMEQPDLTPLVSIEVVNEAFDELVKLDEFRRYGAKFLPIKLQGDNVPLIEQKTGAEDAITMQAYGLGWSQTLKNMLYNKLHNLQKVLDAVAYAYNNERNDLSVIGRMIAKTTATGWDPAQQQAAVTTSGASYGERLYDTLLLGLRKLMNLKDPQNGKPIRFTEAYLLTGGGDVPMMINRTINGQLNVGGKRTTENFEALTGITTIIPYVGDSVDVGETRYTWAGVASGKAYLFVPRVANYVAVKRRLTQEQGMGSVMALEQLGYAWYFIQKEYDAEFFGGSSGGTSGTGYCVEVTIPTS